MEAASVSEPRVCPGGSGICPTDRKIYSKAPRGRPHRAGDVSADRVILLGKRQRADERREPGGQGMVGGTGGSEGNLQETIFTEFVPEH